MFKYYIYIILVIAIGLFQAKSTTPKHLTDTNKEEPVLDWPSLLYEEIQLHEKISYEVFEMAMKGYNKLLTPNKEVLTVIDFSKPSTEKRLYVIDLKQKKILYASHVSHGKNSGNYYAVNFSNQIGSYKSSLGFYITENTYQGQNGYSLVLNGLEKGINDNAKQRSIVIHGADYCNPEIVKNGSRLGRSQGCPALPHQLCKPIIDTIKEGSLLFIYANDNQYLAQSPVLTESIDFLNPLFRNEKI